MEARTIAEALVRCEGLFGIIIKGGDQRALQYQAYSDNGMGMIAGIRPRWVSDKEEARFPSRHAFNGRRLQ
jgi:hypothetical protein